MYKIELPSLKNALIIHVRSRSDHVQLYQEVEKVERDNIISGININEGYTRC